MILSDKTITKRLSELIWIPKSDKSVTVEGLLSQINPNSFDLTISDTFKRPVNGLDAPIVYGFQNKHEQEVYQQDYWQEYVSPNGYILLKPNHVVLACTREYIRMPKDLCGQLFTKSTLGRMFINHMMAGVIDAGFEGRLTLELKNDGIHTIRIPVGARIVQMVIYKLDYVPDEAYNDRNSRYMNAETVECAKWAELSKKKM